MRLYSADYIITLMSSIVVEESHKKSYNKIVVTANLAQNNNKAHKVIEKKIQKFFLICESCFWCASYCDLYYD